MYYLKYVKDCTPKLQEFRTAKQLQKFAVAFVHSDDSWLDFSFSTKKEITFLDPDQDFIPYKEEFKIGDRVVFFEDCGEIRGAITDEITPGFFKIMPDEPHYATHGFNLKRLVKKKKK